MTDKETLMNWLTTCFQQPVDRLSELFYFDKRDDQFFSILLGDYFLFDDQLNLSKDTTSTYSKKSLETLQDRMKRIDKNDLDILVIPRFELSDEMEIQNQINIFLHTNKIDLDTATIWRTEDPGTTTIDLTE